MRSIMITGRGTSGSWKIRGEQMGLALGATVAPGSTDAHGHDVVIVVKRFAPQQWLQLRQQKAKIVWDIVDAWPQPDGNLWNRAQALHWLSHTIDGIKPHGIVAASPAMARDVKALGFDNVMWLPHHARPDIRANPIRKKVEVVGYEGGDYLGKFEDIICRWCARHGATFVKNPQHLADLDIVVALREVHGYPATHWKSNVKLANAQGSGTPCVIGQEDSYLATASGGEKWAHPHYHPESIEQALDSLLPQDERMRVSNLLRDYTIELQLVAKQYRAWLSNMKF